MSNAERDRTEDQRAAEDDAYAEGRKDEAEARACRGDYPAFPSHGSMGEVAHEGMTLRDYFAIHSVQPGCGEIASMAGLHFRDGGIWANERERIGSFDAWFNALSIAERLALFARVKYVMADAMLEARLA